MARTGVAESDPAAARVAELKKELQRLVMAIVEDDDFRTETVDQAREALFSLKELKLRKKRSSPSLKLDDGLSSCPQDFRCPLSKDLMRDPVVVSTGQTYDRPFIQKWLKAGNRTCPLTQQVLSHTILTPNHLIREMISQWCKCQGIEQSSDSDRCYLNNEEVITEAERHKFLSLIGKISSPSPPDQKEAAKELRSLTKRTPSFRALFGESLDAVPRLLRSLSDGEPSSELQEDVITTLLNLSIHDGNKKIVAETPTAIPILIEALRSGTLETRSNAAATIFTLSALDSNKSLIGKSGALRPLIELLEEGNSSAVKDAASAIFNLCIVHENKVRAVREGAVSVIVAKIGPRESHVDELLAILAMLATHQRAVDEISDLGAVPCLLGIIRESRCDRTKENCAAILYSICLSHRSKWREMREEERVHGTISKLSANGTSRAKRKASGILERLNRAVNLTHTA